MKKLLCGAIGSCVHIAGLYRFTQLAEKEGYLTTYLGGAVPVQKMIDAIVEVQPDIVAISYRLSAEAMEKILEEFFASLEKVDQQKRIFLFGGTVETTAVARSFPQFSRFFDGSEDEEEVVLFLRNQTAEAEDQRIPPQRLGERIAWKKPYPLIRHHIGLPTLGETEEEVKILAESRLLDIISLAPDQNAQQSFFRPKEIDPKQDGAGGAPFRCEADFQRMYAVSRRGNHPLMRCYSGTRDLIPFSQVLIDTVHNAWAAVPLTWYSALDRRSDRPLLEAIQENQRAIRYNAERKVPVEINEAHQWALRFAHDAMDVATSYIAALNAYRLGVNEYVMQFMLCTPAELSPKMDLAKALAKWEMVQPLIEESEKKKTPFHIYKMIRTGLLSYKTDTALSKGQLTASMFYGAFLEPDIVHVVAFCEAVRRATSVEILESVKMVKQALNMAYKGLPDLSADQELKSRKDRLIIEASVILDAIAGLDRTIKDPLCTPEIIEQAILTGILDAPGLSVGPAKAVVKTGIVNGANESLDENGAVLSEKERIGRLAVRPV
ncbi:MAG TPA: methionine synthase [Thermotogota bacterium]|nr:methionine synthase [Thermotogota bacterium]NLZ14329.1 methionine synthase [Thermotogaceae bacterium]MDD8052459.1 methionine synthase [Thermotogota bacterium]HNR63821.1 methionine synthase [Thermotogota bacterium]HNT96497.1 methionine synthase [Thermotogota bacterium]